MTGARGRVKRPDRRRGRLGDRVPRLCRSARNAALSAADSPRRRLPPVHALMDHPALSEMKDRLGREVVLGAVRSTLDRAREALGCGEAFPSDPSTLALMARSVIESERPNLRPVFNATGILLHTGLGRAPLAEEAIEAVSHVVRGYCNLEFDLETGERGRRTSGVSELLAEITGAEAATVVNNNAGATILALKALAAGKDVIVSRGELVEIGGSFRLPEIFEVSGVRLREVGTTNKTRLSDYEKAIGPETAAILRVHPSNYRIVGFTESVPLPELAVVAQSRGLRLIDDIGSGALGPARPPGVRDEPTVAEGIACGADIVLFSGDKLLGGPQCGLLVGTRDAVDKVERDPLMRALRVDKMILAALEATLRLMRDPARAAARIPLWSFMTVSAETLRARAERIADRLRSEGGLEADAVESQAYLGGGSVPAQAIPSYAVRVRVEGESDWARRLRLGEPAVVPRVQGGAVWFDLRAIPEADDSALIRAILDAARAGRTVTDAV